MDAIEERRRQLFAELRELNRKMPPDRFDDNFIPPFLRKNQSVILRLRRRKVA
jgi:hypothetical protein